MTEQELADLRAVLPFVDLAQLAAEGLAGWARLRDAARREEGCPDGGTCGHARLGGCWRTEGWAGPLSAAGWGDTWPDEVLAAERAKGPSGGGDCERRGTAPESDMMRWWRQAQARAILHRAARAEYERARWVLDALSIEEYSWGIDWETPAFWAANRAVAEAEARLPRLVTWWIDLRVLKEQSYWVYMGRPLGWAWDVPWGSQ